MVPSVPGINFMDSGAFNPPSQLHTTVLTELATFAGHKGILMMEIIKRGRSFLDENTLQALKMGTYTWLSQALVDIRAS